MSNHDSSEHHEEFHMPSPSWAPIIVSAGATLTFVGIVLRGWLIIGLLILAVGVGMWAFSRSE